MGRYERRMKRTNFGDSLWGNHVAWSFYAERLMDLAISSFQWNNLPDTVDQRYLELILFKNGNAVFFKDEELGHLALQCMNNGYFNVYTIPNRRRAFAVNGYQKQLTKDDSVIIYNNMLHKNSVLTVEYFAKRLWDLDCTIDVNCRTQKTPVLIQCSENQRLTLENLYMQYDGNMPVIYAEKDLNVMNGLKVLKTDAPFVADKLYQYKTQLWNEALTYLGISNVNFQKKERMVSDEVVRGLGGIMASRHSRLESRKQACEEINRMFGLDISVEFRPDYREQDDEFMIEQDGDLKKLVPMVDDVRTNSGENMV